MHGAHLLGCLLLLSTAQATDEAPAGIPDPDAVIRVDPARRLHSLSPLLHGHFLEFMHEGIKGGLWAELLRNRGFEEEAPRPAASHRWERYPDSRNDDPGLVLGGSRLGIDEQGYPVAFSNRAQVIVSVPERNVPRGIYQPDIPVRGGVAYRGSLWIRGAAFDTRTKAVTGGSFEGRLRITLEEDTPGGAAWAERELQAPSREWRRHEFELIPRSSDPRARFTIQVEGKGVLWIDQASLLQANAIAGVRADVFQRIQDLRPAFLRWPGGNVAQDYHWTWGTGDRDARPSWVNLSWNDELEPADFGTVEFVDLARAVGAEPTLVVNVEGRGVTWSEAAALRRSGKDIHRDGTAATAEEAAAWVEYANGPPSSREGARRAAQGRPDSLRVKYWEIGNEIWGDWVRGHSNAATYARNAKRYIRAMRAVDPTIRVIAVGAESMDWNATVLREIGGDIDLLSIHHYYGERESGGDPRKLLARPLAYERLYARLGSLIREAVPGREVKLAVNEFNTLLSDPEQHSMLSGLFAARLLHVFERRGDLVAMSAVSDLVNGWSGGIIQASRHRVFTTATYHVIRAYRRHTGAWALPCEVLGGPAYDPGDRDLGPEVPALDAAASLSEDGKDLYIKLVNTDTERDVRARIEVQGPGRASRATAVLVTGPTLRTSNTFAEPSIITERPHELSMENGAVSALLPRHSVLCVRLELGSPRE